MKVYRLKHLPTGLYYRPSRDVKVKGADGVSTWVKSNLSKDGKVYTSKPSLSWVEGGFYNHLAPQRSSSWRRSERVDTYRPEDWAVEEVA